ncbi:MAG: heme A synthase [Acidimicrobiaceae bacterium]|nr:COX15/CtaA family protein [Acidimicrobiaceae bacterium]MYA74679.1 heme A synthase [Acidimicrobiaceae bacterium]MYG54479.1 heme A synthase [Acidimicrobiaceae bacterium]MYJ98957.1 heme A synthase [Acidimicrobiaceae bacterium]
MSSIFTSLRAVAFGPVSPARYVSWTRGALWSLTVIVVSGGAVRLTGSGLGCSDWPNCEEDQFVADLEYHALIEFVNRLFTGVVAAAVILAVLGSLRRSPRRRDLVLWSWGLVAGVAAQVVLGAVLVKTELDPRFTMGHFLLSMVLLANAVVLVELAGRDDGVARRVAGPFTPAARIIYAVGAILLVSGTIVTGSGPHSGSDEAEVAERLPFLVREVTRIHSIIALILLFGVVWLIRSAHLRQQPEIRWRATVAASLLIAQGVVGYWQYFAGVPVLLVGVHILGASLSWIAIIRLHLSTTVDTAVLVNRADSRETVT